MNRDIPPAPSTELPPGVSFGPMRSDEVTTLVEWAADESWNPGVADVSIGWEVDPDAFVAVRRDGQMLGAGSVFSYDGAFGFMGLFIVRPELRGHGLGTALWYRRRQLMLDRLRPGASVGMDGVFAMVPFYERGGFELAYRDLRFDGVAPDAVADVELPDGVRLVPISDVPRSLLHTFDDRHVAAPRHRFLDAWLEVLTTHSAVAMLGDEVVGMAVLRACRSGYRFGPVHADTSAIASALIRSLLGRVPGAPIQLDVPEPNEAGLDIAASLGMVESFGCARMYLGADPQLPVSRIFGVTSFDFG